MDKRTSADGNNFNNYRKENVAFDSYLCMAARATCIIIPLMVIKQHLLIPEPTVVSL